MTPSINLVIILRSEGVTRSEQDYSTASYKKVERNSWSSGHLLMKMSYDARWNKL